MKVDEGSILINVQVSFSLSQSVNHFFDVRVCVAFFFRLGLGLLVLPLEGEELGGHFMTFIMIDLIPHQT